MDRKIHVKSYERYKNGKWEHVSDYEKKINSPIDLSKKMLDDIRSGKSVKLLVEQNFKTASGSDIVGTGRIGTMNLSYDKIFEALGEPTLKDGDGDKTDAEWHVKFNDGTVATIYNYKDGKNYNGSSGKDVDVIREWHIGGKGDHGVIKRNLRNLLDIPISTNNFLFDF